MIVAEKTLVNVNKGQDAYSVIGNYILNHVTAIEDMIAVIQINGVIIKELYMADGDADGYFYWDNDWWEGEEDVALLDFFPVSDAERIKWIPVTEPPKKPDNYPKCEIRRTYYLVSLESGCVESLGYDFDRNDWMITGSPVVAWMQLPQPWEGEKE